MPKALRTDKAAFDLVCRKLAENREGFNQSQLCLMLQALDRWAKRKGYYKVDLTPPMTPYDRNPSGKSKKEDEEEKNPYTPKMTLEEAFGQIGGADATNQSSQ